MAQELAARFTISWTAGFRMALEDEPVSGRWWISQTCSMDKGLCRRHGGSGFRLSTYPA